jgi:hypothetical protein
MNKFSGLLVTFLLLAAPAAAEIRAIDLTIFGMD